MTRDFSSRREKIFERSKGRKAEEPGADRYYVDLRIFGIGNWSHFLNKALPVAILIRDQLMERSQPSPVFILNKSVFPQITQMLSHLNMEFICTNRAVKAPQVAVKASSFSIIDGLSRTFVRSALQDIERLVEAVPNVPGPDVFLNRRTGSRSISNAAEIKDMLTTAGYAEIFMEDYSAAEQIAIILRASRIVAIHGAALAPLMLRNGAHGPFELFEIVSPGHVVPFFRNMITDLPCIYRMIRGVPDTAMTSGAFSNLDPPTMQFTKQHSLRPFRVDPASLSFAFKSIEDEDFPIGSINQPAPAG